MSRKRLKNENKLYGPLCNVVQVVASLTFSRVVSGYPEISIRRLTGSEITSVHHDARKRSHVTTEGLCIAVEVSSSGP